MRELDQVLARAYGGRPAATDRPASAKDQPGPAPPRPHFALAGEPEPALRWPDTVLALEREHGARFERLAADLLRLREERQLKVLLFTSCHRAEGRTTLVLTLARALARRPGRTLMVDADLSGPMLARQLGLRPRAGLDDVVERGVAPGEALVESPDDHLTVLPLRAAVARPREFLALPAWSCLMARLRREYDLVLLDGSPLFTGLSAAVLHRSVDAAILVHNRSLTGERALVRAQEVLEGGGISLLGLAETFV
jgi:Mrp family chromosome partitioning ATPase